MFGLTLAALAVLATISIGFMTLTHADIRHLDEKFDRKFDGVNQRFDSVNDRFDSVNERFDGLQKDISLLRADIGEVKGELRSLGTPS